MAEENLQEHFESTLEQVHAFMESTVWQDIIRELLTWESAIRDIQDSDDNVVELYRCQGRMEAISNFIGLPNTIALAIETVINYNDRRNGNGTQ